MKRAFALWLALMLGLGAVSALADGIRMNRLTLEFVPAADADAIIAATGNLPGLIQDEMAGLGYDIAEVDISVGASYRATAEAVSEGDVDVCWLPAGTYADCSRSGGAAVILTATCPGLSNDSEVPADWNGDANRTLPGDRQFTYYRSLILAGPSEKGRALAAKANAGQAIRWDELDDCVWAVGNASSFAGYLYPAMWLMDRYDGRKLSDLSHVISMGYADAFAKAASGQVDIICCYADGRCDYETAWTLPRNLQDDAGRQGMGREDSIWNEMNVIGVTSGILNDAVAITTARPEINNPGFIAALQQALINIIGTDEGREIFAVVSHTGYAIAGDSDYDAVRQALTLME